jgi:glycerol-3-phosphate dehydrogenase
MNLVTRPVPGKVAVGLSCKRAHNDEDALLGKGSRFLFIVPWRNVSMIGTSHGPYQGEPNDVEASEREIQELIDDINGAYPGARLERDDVRLVQRGILPMVAGSGSSSGVTLSKQYTIQDHRREGIEGLLTIVGVKYTTARDVAEKVVDRVFDLLGKRAPASTSSTTPLHGGDIERFEPFLADAIQRKPAELSEEAVRHLAHAYGTAYREVLAPIEDHADLAHPVHDGSPVLKAELVHAVREEMAMDLPSVVLRRTELGSAGTPGRAVLETVATILASELGWDSKRVESEIDRVETIFRKRS